MNLPLMSYGKERRALILQFFQVNPEGRLTVDCRCHPQVKSDPDLTKLIKLGILTQWKERHDNPLKGKSSTGRTTFLLLSKSVV